MEEIVYTDVPSPVGRLTLAQTPSGLAHIRFESDPKPVPPTWRRVERLEGTAAEQLAAYFAGALRRFELPLDPAGTPFQKEVWAALRDVPYGTTVSYADVARRIGRPEAVRAVGAANGRNPLPIVVPCHRVVGSGGALTGYSGGLAIKRALLALEGIPVADPSRQMSLF